MLQNIHDKSKGFLMYIVVGILIMVFAMWGIGYYLRGSSGPHASMIKVNGISITQASLNREYQGIRRQFPGAIGDAKIVALKKKAMHHLIKDAALYSSATGMGIGIAVKTLDEWITHAPAFQHNGHFARSRFEMTLRAMGVNLKMFRHHIKQTFMVGQVKKGILQSDFALPSEAAEYAKLIGEKRIASYIIIPSSHFKSQVHISDDQIRVYYRSHRKNFFTQPMVKLAYLELSLKDIEKNMSGALVDRASKAQTQYSELGQKLANLTFENPSSLQYTAMKLGLQVKHTGYFAQTGSHTGLASNTAVVRAAFSKEVLKNRNNSDVINLSDTRAIVIRVANFRKAHPRLLSQVRGEIKALLMKQFQMRAAKASAEKLLKGSLKQSGYEFVSTQAYQRNSKALPLLLLNALFLQPQGKSRSVVKLSDGYAVLNYQKTVYPKVTEDNFNRALFLGIIRSISYNQYVAHVLAKADIKRES